MSLRGQWIVVLRDIPANEDELIGPYHSEEAAERVAERLRRDIAARAADHWLEAVAKWVRPGLDIEEARDEMLRDLDEMGYPPQMVVGR